DMVRVDDSGEPGVSTDWNFGDTNASTWEGLELDVVTKKEWGRGYGEIKDRKVEDTKAYAALKKLGLVDDAGKLVRTPVYFKAPKTSERGEVVYRIQDLGPYYAHLTYVAKGVVVSSGQAATNSGMWDMVIGEATEEDWVKGS
ncbi:MAG: hypothetical protein NBV63_01435, partial [Candidatus Pacebacteria bacterium]|nr:hypothetical protein [Candidatus Paceibacterota bacterium]